MATTDSKTLKVPRDTAGSPYSLV